MRRIAIALAAGTALVAGTLAAPPSGAVNLGSSSVTLTWNLSLGLYHMVHAMLSSVV